MFSNKRYMAQNHALANYDVLREGFASLPLTIHGDLRREPMGKADEYPSVIL